MKDSGNIVGPERAEQMLGVLGMPKTVMIMRHLHMNGWFELDALGRALELDGKVLADHLEAMDRVGLVERRNGVEFRLNRNIPELNLTRIATEVGPFLKCAKFYSNIVFATLEKANELDHGLSEAVTHIVIRTNGWKDQRAKAVLSCFDFNGGPAATYDNFQRMVAQGVLGPDDIDILKKVSLCMLVAMIANIEAATDRNMGRLLMRVGSREAMEEFSSEIDRYKLLESLPEEYFRQV